MSNIVIAVIDTLTGNLVGDPTTDLHKIAAVLQGADNLEAVRIKDGKRKSLPKKVKEALREAMESPDWSALAPAPAPAPGSGGTTSSIAWTGEGRERRTPRARDADKIRAQQRAEAEAASRAYQASIDEAAAESGTPRWLIELQNDLENIKRWGKDPDLTVYGDQEVAWIDGLGRRQYRSCAPQEQELFKALAEKEGYGLDILPPRPSRW